MEKDFTDENELFEAVVKALEDEKLVTEESPQEQQTSMASMFTSSSKGPIKVNMGDYLSEK